MDPRTPPFPDGLEDGAVKAFLSTRPSRSLSAVHYSSRTRYYYGGRVLVRFSSGDPPAHYDRVISALLRGSGVSLVQANLLWMAVARYYTCHDPGRSARPDQQDKPSPSPVPKRPAPGVKYIPGTGFLGKKSDFSKTVSPPRSSLRDRDTV